MHPRSIAAALVLSSVCGAAVGTGGGDPETAALKEARISIEYSAAADEGALVVSAESETGLDQVELRDPSGNRVLGLATSGRGRNPALFGFELEAGESAPAALLQAYPEGAYQIRARTPEGRLAIGTAVLSHRLPSAPRILVPQDGDVVYARAAMRIAWVPDPLAAEYRVNLEQGETDRMSARLAAGTGSFEVPDGVLQSGRRYRLEIGAVGPEGNVTISEALFVAR